MAAGVPVVSSNTSCLPEVLGDAAFYFDPSDPAAGAQQVAAILRSSDLRERLVAAGIKQTHKFPWAVQGELTLRAYERFGRCPESVATNFVSRAAL